LQTISGRQNVDSFGPEGMKWYAHIAEVHQKVQEELTGEVKQEQLPKFVAPLRGCVAAYPQTATASLDSNDMRPQIRGAINHFEQLGDQIRTLKNQLVPRPLRMVFWILVWLTLVGVAWPMAELWVLTGEAPVRMVALVAAFVAGVLALVGYFSYVLWEMGQLGRFRWDPKG